MSYSLEDKPIPVHIPAQFNVTSAMPLDYTYMLEDEYSIDDYSKLYDGKLSYILSDNRLKIYNENNDSWYNIYESLHGLPLANSSTQGAIKIGYTANGKNYPLQLDHNGQAFVNIPWINTTYNNATQSTNGLMSAADKKKLDELGTTQITGNFIKTEDTSETGDIYTKTYQCDVNNNKNIIWQIKPTYSGLLSDNELASDSFTLQCNTSYSGTNLVSSIKLSNSIDVDQDSNETKTTKIDLNADVVQASGIVNAPNGFFQVSDINKKNVIEEISLDKCYDLIDKCQTIVYTLKDDITNTKQIGVIAQEVEQFFPEIVNTNNKGEKTLDYSKLTVILLRVVKDLITKIK